MTVTSVVPFPMAASPSERVAEEIRAEMARKRVTQVQLAELLHLRQSAISRRINGVVPFDANELVVVAQRLGVTVGQLFGERPAQDDPKPPSGLGAWAPRGSNPEPTDYKSATSAEIVHLAARRAQASPTHDGTRLTARGDQRRHDQDNNAA